MFARTFDRAVFESRRRRFAGAFAGRPALLAAGVPRPRNDAANEYPFRAASHFLYLTGLSHPGGFLFFDGERFTLFLPPPAPDDALWHGVVPTFAEIEARTGCTVKSVDGLGEALGNAPVATLPTPDLETCEALAGYLKRPVRPGALADADAALADVMISLRLRHDAGAIAEMRIAANDSAAVHRAGMRATRPGIREADVRAAMEAETLSRDVAMAYNPIVTVHGEVLHNHAYHHELGERDLVLADVGAESPGWFASDVTRTWPVSGRFSSTQRDLYEVVLRAQRAAIEAVRPGVRYRDVHLEAGRELARGLVALGILSGDVEELVQDGVVWLLFPHGVGHLIGLDVHDMEDLGDRAGYAPGRTRAAQFGIRYLRLDRDLEPGMAVTIEPGLYLVPAILGNDALMSIAKGRLHLDRLERFRDVRGIRIEDDVLVTEGGREVLTAAIPKAPDEVEAAVGG